MGDVLLKVLGSAVIHGFNLGDTIDGAIQRIWQRSDVKADTLIYVLVRTVYLKHLLSTGGVVHAEHRMDSATSSHSMDMMKMYFHGGYTEVKGEGV